MHIGSNVQILHIATGFDESCGLAQESDLRRYSLSKEAPSCGALHFEVWGMFTDPKALFTCHQDKLNVKSLVLSQAAPAEHPDRIGSHDKARGFQDRPRN